MCNAFEEKRIAIYKYFKVTPNVYPHRYECHSLFLEYMFDFKNVVLDIKNIHNDENFRSI